MNICKIHHHRRWWTLSIMVHHLPDTSVPYTFTTTTTYLTLEANRWKSLARARSLGAELSLSHTLTLSLSLDHHYHLLPDIWSTEDGNLCQELAVLGPSFLQPLAILPPWKRVLCQWKIFLHVKSCSWLITSNILIGYCNKQHVDWKQARYILWHF